MDSTVLLADDSITVQKIVKLSLAEEGIDVVTVGNGEQAVQKLQEMRPSLVLADVFMPGRDGYEVCEYIKAQPALADLPVILLVHAYEPFDAERAKQVGADDHLTKPFQSISTLVEAVQSRLSPANPAKAAEASLAAPADAEDFRESSLVAPLSALDWATPGETAAEDNPLSELATPAAPAAAPAVSCERATSTAPADVFIPLIAEEHLTVAPLPEANNSPTHSEEELMLPMLEEVAEPVGLPHLVLQPEQSVEPLHVPTGVLEGGDEVLDLDDVLTSSPFAALPETDLLADAEGIPALTNFAPADTTPEPPPEAAPQELISSPLISFDLAIGQRVEAAEVIQDEVQTPAAPLEVLHLAAPGEAVVPPQAPEPEVAVSPTAPLPAANADALVSEAVIDKIVSRVVERLSTKAIEEIAWEVVPELAETIIRRQLAEPR